MKLNHNLDTSQELQIIRYGQGIKLIKPHSFKKSSYCDVGTLLQSFFNVFFVSADYRLVQINEACANLCEFNSVTSAIGKTAYDFATKKTAISAQQTDQEVISSNTQLFFENEFSLTDGLNNTQLTLKTPWYNQNNKIIGLLGLSIKIGSQSLTEVIKEFLKIGLLNIDNALHYQKTIPSSFQNNHISKREKEILNFLIRGKTAKFTAEILRISPRTVEQHLNNIKIKLNVKTKSELIEKVVDDLL